MLVTVSDKIFSGAELWELRDGVWTYWGYVASDYLSPLRPDLNKPVR